MKLGINGYVFVEALSLLTILSWTGWIECEMCILLQSISFYLWLFPFCTIPFANGSKDKLWSNGHLPYYRWWAQRVVPRKGLPMAKLVGLSNRHRHLLIWRKLWTSKLSYYINWCRGSKTSHALSNEDMMIMFPWHLDIRISLVPSPRCSTGSTSPWMQMHGFEP